MKTAINTLVLGAGASMDYGFPSGQMLKELTITTLTTNDSPEYKVLIGVGEKMGFGSLDIVNFLNDLQAATMDPSIDSFIEAQQDRKDCIDVYEKIAKSIIAILIIKSEQVSKIPLGEGWYEKLFEKMYEDRRTYSSFLENKISFITFNYDRSLEYYLTEAVKQQFHKTSEDSQTLGCELIVQLPILHVHGSVGDYWSGGLDANFTPYGSDWTNVYNIINCASKIRLITDKINVDLDPDFQNAQELIKNADSVHFIGFGFHRNNMKRLGFRSEDEAPELGKFFGTVKGLSPQKVTECTGEYGLMTHPNGFRFTVCESVAQQDASEYLDLAPLC